MKKTPFFILVDLLNEIISCNEKPLEECETVLDRLEVQLFENNKNGNFIKELFHVKRKITVVRRLLWHTLNIVQKLAPPSEHTEPIFQDLRENAKSY